jgi:hypothetical protein
MLDVGDERVGVGGHVGTEEARPVCDWVCHGCWLREFSTNLRGTVIQENAVYKPASRPTRGRQIDAGAQAKIDSVQFHLPTAG